MASQGSKAALNNPLILSCIFQNLEAKNRYKTLLRCMCVSKLWEEEARRVLFRQVGQCEADRTFALRNNFMLGPDLFEIIYMPTSIDRKRAYTRCVRTIRIDATPEQSVMSGMYQDHHRVLATLDFSLVREVVIDDPRVWQLYRPRCPVYMGENLSKLVIHNTMLHPQVFVMIGIQCPKIKHLEIGPDVPVGIARFVSNLDLLETLVLGGIPPEEDERLFKAVVHHASLQSVTGLPVQRLWIWAESRILSIPWCKSIKHIGAVRVMAFIDEDPDMYDYAESLELLAKKTPTLVSLQIQAYTKTVLERVVALDQIQELEIAPRYSDDSGGITVAETLESLLSMRNLRALRFPQFHRCRKDKILPQKASMHVSWRTVWRFTGRMPNLQELSFCQMHLNGFTPGHAPSALDWSPVVWRKDRGWEIMDWDIASPEFKRAMSDIGRFMPHDYFGPFHHCDEALYDYIDSGRNGSDNGDDERWRA